MVKRIAYVGLDVHKESITIAVAEQGREKAVELATIPNHFPKLLKVLRRFEQEFGLTVRCCYEAGPTGFGLYRRLNQEGIVCEVIAPSLVPRQPGRRIKTDRRDAVQLAHYYRSGNLTVVAVPDEATEAVRDLERDREDAKKAERVARSQLSKFLLRHDRRWEGKTNWTQKHLDWIRAQSFSEDAQNWVLIDYLETVERATVRINELTKRIEEVAETWSSAPLVKALQAFRGIRLVTAVVIAAELGDLRRFPKPSDLMGYLGLVPSENTTGQSQHRGPITKTGNQHVRWVLVETAWQYRFQPRMSEAIRKRNDGVAPAVRQIAWKAQKRLHGRFKRLTDRGKPGQVAVTAVARELAGFLWAVGQQSQWLES